MRGSCEAHTHGSYYHIPSIKVPAPANTLYWKDNCTRIAYGHSWLWGSHYLDGVLAEFAVVVMFDNVSSTLACRSSHLYLPLHHILLHINISLTVWSVKYVAGFGTSSVHGTKIRGWHIIICPNRVAMATAIYMMTFINPSYASWRVMHTAARDQWNGH